MGDLVRKLLETPVRTYSSVYRGEATAEFRSKDWDRHVRDAFGSDSPFASVSENVFRQAVDSTTQWLVSEVCPGLVDAGRNLVLRGEALLIVTDGDPVEQVVGPAAFAAMSDGDYTIVARFYKSLRDRKSKALVVDSDGEAALYTKPSLGKWEKEKDKLRGVRFAHLKSPFAGIGDELAALQDRVTHSTVDQTIVAEMYTRPFWYLLNHEDPEPINPYLAVDPSLPAPAPVRSKKTAAGGRLFTTPGPGPFGQLTPPSLKELAEYHDSLVAAVERCAQVPRYLLWQGAEPPSGVALQLGLGVFLRRIKAYRSALSAGLQRLFPEIDAETLWPARDDTVQALADVHGLNLAGMGMPPEFIAQRVLGESVAKYESDTL